MTQRHILRWRAPSGIVTALLDAATTAPTYAAPDERPDDGRHGRNDGSAAMATMTTPRPTTPLPRDPLTVGQAAARIGVSREWARQLAERGEIRATRTPLGWLVDAADVERYRAARAGEDGAR